MRVLMQHRVTDMQTSRWSMVPCRRWIAAAAALAAIAAGGPPATAQEDNLPDAKLFRYLVKGLGLTGPDNPGIEYRERSPLVVPPELTLPPPDTRSAAQRYPNWPIDPEIRAAKERADSRKQASVSLEEQERPLMPDELERGRRTGRGPTAISPQPHQGGRALLPSALGSVGNMFTSVFNKKEDEAKPFTGEPQRATLTDPPPGYQTPSPTFPYGIGKEGPAPLPVDPHDPTRTVR
jgi:hypothetical protein